MNLNMSCVQKEWERFCQAVNRPVVRKRIDAKMGIYSDENTSRPVMSFDVDGEWCYKLSCAVKVLGISMAILFMAYWVFRFFRNMLWC